MNNKEKEAIPVSEAEKKQEEPLPYGHPGLVKNSRAQTYSIGMQKPQVPQKA